MVDRRRVEVCRALVSDPRLVLLDEPSAGMTHDETRELMDDILMVRSQRAPFAVVIIEHEMDVIQRITQRCVVLSYGKKIAEGSFDEITRHPEVQAAYLGHDAQATTRRRCSRSTASTARTTASMCCTACRCRWQPAASPAFWARTAPARAR